MVKPLLDPVVAAKIEIVTPGPEILKFIPPENLQKSFGGASKYEYEYIPPAENESKTNHLGPDELIQLELELEDLQTRLVDTAVAINSLFVNQEIQINENDLTLVALLEICSDLKQQISSRWALIDAHFIPKNMYHRLGVMQENGEICWPSN